MGWATSWAIFSPSNHPAAITNYHGIISPALNGTAIGAQMIHITLFCSIFVA
jgi:hypothetical protein